MLDTRFLDELASAAPTPGGGGASAYVGALSAALASMVGNLTVGKKTYAAIEDEVAGHVGALRDLRQRLVELVDEDARAFEPLAAAYRMPKGTEAEREAKRAALQDALAHASAVPLDIMRTAAAVIEHADYLARNGSRMARSDAGVSAAFARAAVDGASLNVFINAASMEDAQAAARLRDEASSIADDARRRCDELFAFVKAEVS